MAWITSATSGGAMAKCQWTLLRAGLLLAHLAFLGAIWRDRSARAETHVGDLATPDTASLALHPASFALLTGLLLALTLVSRPGFVPPRRLTAASGRTPSPDQPTCEIGAPVHHAAAGGLPVEAHAGLMARLNHDLRTPLNAMLGFADMMKVEAFGPLGDVRYRDYAAHMQTCGRDLLEATESTLAMAALLTRSNVTDHGSKRLQDLAAEASALAQQGNTEQARPLAICLTADLTLKGDIASIRQGLVHLLVAARARAGAHGPVEFVATSGYGRINAAVSVKTAASSQRPATTGCRPATSTWPSIEEMPITLARTLFCLQGIPFAETTDANGMWIVSLSFEDAAQSDLFDAHRTSGKPAPDTAVPYSAGFFGGASLSRSRSA